MKKILSLVLCLVLCLCACSKGDVDQEDKIDISFQKIAATNNRTKLLEKFPYILERTSSRESDSDNFSYWTMYFEKNNESYNAILDYGDEYKCYYYNGDIYADYGDAELRKVLPYRENYERIVAGLLARADTLSYVFINKSEAVKTDEGYDAEYSFIVNGEILAELEGLGVKQGETVTVKYELDNDYIIQRCKYYRYVNDKKIEVARIDITYGEKQSFPENIANADENAEYVAVNVIEDFGTGSEYRETFNVKKGSYVSENDVLMRYYLFKDPFYQQPFDTFSEKLEKNQDIFIIDSTYADILASRQAYYEELAQAEGEVVSE